MDERKDEGIKDECKEERKDERQDENEYEYEDDWYTMRRRPRLWYRSPKRDSSRPAHKIHKRKRTKFAKLDLLVGVALMQGELDKINASKETTEPPQNGDNNS